MSRRGGKNSAGSIPNRWLGCPRKSLQLLVDKFLIFKTPLSHRYDDQVPEECLFPVDFVFNSMKSYKLKLGLWIDLTFTSRFYDKEDVERHDCKYLKLQCRGYGQPPTEDQTRTFIEVCHKFISQNPLDIVGVHCTHGFNRSGFLVVSYLVEKFDWELGAAIMKFAQARPPGIYKKDYLVELYRRYDDEEFAPEAPPLPDWCYEEEENDDADDNKEEDDNSNDFSRKRKETDDDKDSNERGNHKKRKKEFVKKNPTFMAGVPGVEPVTDPVLVESIQRTVQDMCLWERKGFPGSQPVSMTLENMHYLSKEEYASSWKADGNRYLMYIKERDEVFFLDRDNCVFRVNNLTFPYRKDINVHIKRTLLDGEMVIDREKGQNIPNFLVYDIIMINDYPIREKGFFPTRYDVIRLEIEEPRHKANVSGVIVKRKEPFGVRRKLFLPARDAAKFLSEKFRKSLTHEPDGLIFQPARDPYIPGQFDKLLKWKPASLNSVDFKLKITMEKGVGIVPKKIGELYVGGYEPRFGVLKSVKNLHDLNNKIIECKFDNGSWVFMRERTDKSFPNSFDTAKSVWNSIINPVTDKMLLDLIESSVYVPQMPPPLAPPPRPHCSRDFR